MKFTLLEYRNLLEKTRAAYSCVGFEVLDNLILPETFAIIRHDIDMSPQQAFLLADIESSLNIKSTYTVLLTGDFYSPFEKNIRDILKNISDLGHDIGLHFDAAWHGIDSEQALNSAIAWEAGILNKLLDLKDDKRISMFSFHNTTQFTMSCKDRYYSGLRNAYAGILQNQCEYTSDSNGYWIHRSWDQILSEKHPRIQILTHPEWWRALDAEPGEKVCHEIAQRGTATWASYRTLLTHGNRTNKTGLKYADKLLPNLLKWDGDRILLLWLEGRKQLAYIELYDRFERLIRLLLGRVMRTKLRFPENKVNILIDEYALQLDPLKALSLAAGVEIRTLINCEGAEYKYLQKQRSLLTRSFTCVPRKKLSENFDQLTLAIEKLTEWSETVQHQNTDYGMTDNRKINDLISGDMEEEGSLLEWLKRHQTIIEMDADSLADFACRQSSLCIKKE